MATSITVPTRTARLLVAQGGSNNNYDLLRVLLAFGVIVSHATSVAMGIGAAEPLSVVLQGSSLGDVAVGGFFAISGYLVTASWCTSTPLQYLQKRAARILPGFVVACVITILLACLTSTNPVESAHCTNWSGALITTLTLRRPVVCLAYTNNPYPAETNASLWTIKYEAGCYIATALLGFTGLLKARKPIGILFIALTIASAVLGYSGFARTLFGETLRLAAFYTAGMTVYCLRERLWRSRWLTILCSVAIAIASFNKFLVLIALPITGTYLLFRFVYADLLFAPGLKKKVGDISYGMYLCGWPVSQSLTALFGYRLHSVWLLVGTSLLVCLPLAYMSWHLVEKPVLSLVAGSRHKPHFGSPA
jgi:peptidoglycan/LPS O-acetylase OafA/YrhL